MKLLHRGTKTRDGRLVGVQDGCRRTVVQPRRPGTLARAVHLVRGIHLIPSGGSTRREGTGWRERERRGPRRHLSLLELIKAESAAR